MTEIVLTGLIAIWGVCLVYIKRLTKPIKILYILKKKRVYLVSHGEDVLRQFISPINISFNQFEVNA